MEAKANATKQGKANGIGLVSLMAFSGMRGGPRVYLDESAGNGAAATAAPATPAAQTQGAPAAPVAPAATAQQQNAGQQAFATQLQQLVTTAVAPIVQQQQALAANYTQLQTQIAGMAQPQQQNAGGVLAGRGGAPGVRTGEDPLSSRGYQMIRVSGCFAKSAHDRDQAMQNCKIELQLSEKLREIYGTSTGSGVLVPIASEHIQGFDSTLANECRQVMHAGVAGIDPSHMRQFLQMRQAYRGDQNQALNIYDDEALGVFLGPTQMGELITLLRAKEFFVNAGAREITLPANGRLMMPRHTGSASSGWVGMGPSNRTLTPSQPATGSMLMSAKKMYSLVKVPNDMLKFWTMANEMFIRTDMAESMARELDWTLLMAVGTDLQPKGLVRYPINTVVASTIGADGNKLEPQDIDACVAEVEENNVDPGNFVFGIRPRLWDKVKNRRASAVVSGDNEGPFVFLDIAANALLGNRNVLNGYPVVKTTQIPNNRSKGSSSNLTMLIGGNFNEYLIGRAGVVEFTQSSDGEALMTDDQTLIKAIQYVDGRPRRDEAFVMVDNLLFQ